MKTIKKTCYISLLCLAVVLTGCSSSNDSNSTSDDGGTSGTGGTGGVEYLTAKVDGTVFEAAQDPAVIVAATTSNGVLILHGGQNDGATIRATIQNYTGVGIYTTGDGLSNVNSLTYLTLTPLATWMSTFNIGSGTLEVTADDGTIVEGTFSFEGFNAEDQSTKSITEGSFKATID